MKVWSVKNISNEPVAILKLPRPTARTLCMALVSLRGMPTVWVGGSDEVVVFDARRRLALQSLLTGQECDVMCLTNTGLNRVWSGARNKEDAASVFMEWNMG